MNHAVLVLDIGKTNAKLVLLDTHGAVIAERRTPNTIRSDGLYPHHDTERLWDWLLASAAALSKLAHIGAIVPVTHGATAALIDESGLVLPILDYESTLPQAIDDAYADARGAFAATLSPALPAGLNLGRQLAWLQRTYPRQFARARHILMYPQYWAWRLCGVLASEVTSLGCHTDLWAPHAATWSPLVAEHNWQPLFPPLRKAWDVLGTIHADLAAATGLPAACRVITGIHDSNASLLRHLQGDVGAVLSTGTWVIAAALGTALQGLCEQADMLANVNALGDPVACMRFMGGREFGVLAGEPGTCTLDDIKRIIERGTFALPCFAEAGGPFAGQAGRIDGPPPADARERYALATLYVALMSDYCLDSLAAAGPVIVEGSFTANPYLAGVLAALRPSEAIRVSDDTSGTTYGAWMLANWGAPATSTSTCATALHLPQLDAYRQQWRARLPALSIPAIARID